MPISQRTLLLVHGELHRLAEQVRDLAKTVSNPAASAQPGKRLERLARLIRHLESEAAAAEQRSTIHILADEGYPEDGIPPWVDGGPMHL